MHSSVLIAGVAFGVLWGFCGYRIGGGRGRPVLGAVLGFTLGLVGLGILAIIPRTPEAKAARAARAQQPGTP